MTKLNTKTLDEMNEREKIQHSMERIRVVLDAHTKDDERGNALIALGILVGMAMRSLQ